MYVIGINMQLSISKPLWKWLSISYKCILIILQHRNITSYFLLIGWFLNDNVFSLLRDMAFLLRSCVKNNTCFIFNQVFITMLHDDHVIISVLIFTCIILKVYHLFFFMLTFVGSWISWYEDWFSVSVRDAFFLNWFECFVNSKVWLLSWINCCWLILWRKSKPSCLYFYLVKLLFLIT